MKTRLVTSLAFFIITSCMLASTCTAQSLFDINPQKNDTTQNQTPSTKQVMNPEQFSNTVSRLNKQTDSNMTQEANQQFIKEPLPSPNATLPSNPPPIGGSREAPQQSAPPPSAIESNPNQPVVNNSFAPENSQRAPVSQPGANSLPPTFAPPPSNQAPRNQPYTGFGGGSTNSTTPNSQGSSGGWGVKY